MATPRSNAGRDQNFVPTMMGVSSADGLTPVPIEADPLTGAMLTQGAGGTLVSASFDYVGATYPDAVTETYTYKSGGSAGLTVATITVVYQDSTKALVTSVTKV